MYYRILRIMREKNAFASCITKPRVKIWYGENSVWVVGSWPCVFSFYASTPCNNSICITCITCLVFINIFVQWTWKWTLYMDRFGAPVLEANATCWSNWYVSMSWFYLLRFCLIKFARDGLILNVNQINRKASLSLTSKV